MLAPADLVLQPDDILLVQGSPQNLFAFREALGLTMTPHFVPKMEMLESGNIEVVEARFRRTRASPARPSPGCACNCTRTPWYWHCTDAERRFATSWSSITVAVGDALLLLVNRADLPDLRREGDLILVERSARPAAARQGRAALGIVLAVLVAASLTGCRSPSAH